MKDLILFLGLLFLTISLTEAGECCKAFYDLTGHYHSVQWCPNYCCGTALVGVLSCCDSAALQAPADERLAFCVLWWKHHVWAPILVGLGSLAILVGCCICCYRCCCRRSSHTTIIQSAQPDMQNYQTMCSDCTCSFDRILTICMICIMISYLLGY